jgi:segregation and condensation protein B
MNELEIRNVVEAALMVAQRPLNVDSLLGLFGEGPRPERSQIRDAVETLKSDYEDRGIEIVEVAGGYRIQVRQGLSESVSRLWEERPPRYSRALMETLSLIAYRQPITRGEIEDVRGVSVSTNIIRTLLDRGWVRVLGHRDVPGKPAMYGTTRDFLDYFGLKKLDDLPSLAELRDIDSINVELDLGAPDGPPAEGSDGDSDGGPGDGPDDRPEEGAGGGDSASAADEAGPRSDAGADDDAAASDAPGPTGATSQAEVEKRREPVPVDAEDVREADVVELPVGR